MPLRITQTILFESIADIPAAAVNDAEKSGSLFHLGRLLDVRLTEQLRAKEAGQSLRR